VEPLEGRAAGLADRWGTEVARLLTAHAHGAGAAGPEWPAGAGRESPSRNPSLPRDLRRRTRPLFHHGCDRAGEARRPGLIEGDRAGSRPGPDADPRRDGRAAPRWVDPRTRRCSPRDGPTLYQAADRHGGRPVLRGGRWAGAIPLLRPIRESLAGDRITRGARHRQRHHELRARQDGLLRGWDFARSGRGRHRPLGYAEGRPDRRPGRVRRRREGPPSSPRWAFPHQGSLPPTSTGRGISQVTAAGRRLGRGAIGAVVKLLAILRSGWSTRDRRRGGSRSGCTRRWSPLSHPAGRGPRGVQRPSSSRPRRPGELMFLRPGRRWPADRQRRRPGRSDQRRPQTGVGGSRGARRVGLCRAAVAHDGAGDHQGTTSAWTSPNRPGVLATGGQGCSPSRTCRRSRPSAQQQVLAAGDRPGRGRVGARLPVGHPSGASAWSWSPMLPRDCRGWRLPLRRWRNWTCGRRRGRR